MIENALSFEALPADFQQVIQLAEDRHGINVTPLQELGGGRSGALVFLVRVVQTGSSQPEHLILKLDRKHPKASSDEITRHQQVEQGSPSEFARAHIPNLAYDRVEHNGALAIFYTIAGHSLRSFHTLSGFSRQHHLERLFARTNGILLDEWNPAPNFDTVPHPQKLLEHWLGYRLNPGQEIESFIRDVCQRPVDQPGFIVLGNLLPNPLLYARKVEPWGKTRPLDAAFGYLHRDLNTNNIVARFSEDAESLEAYYLIDFALFKQDMPLLYDQRYLEMSYLIDSLSNRPFEVVVGLLNHYSMVDVLSAEEAPIEMAGTNAAIRAGRIAFRDWVGEKHPSLHDDLWGQYWLAGTAAGLGYCHKSGMEDESRLAGLIYAAANLKQFLQLFDLPLPDEASQLVADDQLGDSRKVPVPQSREEQHNLPAPRTSFIGRESELQEVSGMLQEPETRLVTLTGPGGTGKTRLAQEVARNLLDGFPQGVYFIDLSKINDAELVIPTTAHTIGVREGGSIPAIEKLKDYLARREMLLLFDNFEHVVDSAQAVSELLQAAPRLKALVTSRVPLQLLGEREYPVLPLDVPGEKERTLEELREYESVALFQQSSQAVKPGFKINPENRTAVAEICRRLDGLPLAIELAAARIKMLTPQGLLERLDRRLEFLVSPAKDLPERQKTLRETIAWSYDLLEPTEQELFVRLGIFAGGFSLEAADAVCRSMSETDVFNGVETLLNNSLIRQISSVTNQPRFDMLQTIREFAQSKADDLGIIEDLKQAHFDYFTQLASHDMGSGIFGEDSVLWMDIFEQEHDNLRQGMDWALNHPQENMQALLDIMSQLSWFWYRYGYLQEGSEWMERALQVTDELGVSPARAAALSGRGSLALWSGDLNIAARRTREAMEMAQRLGMDLILGFSKMTYGTVLVNQGKDKEAYPHLVGSIEVYDDLELPWMKGTSMVHLANVSLGMGDIEQALDWLDRAKPLLNSTGDAWSMAFGLSNYGEVARVQGDYEKAEEYYQRTDALYQQADSKGDQARLSTVMGYIAQHKGEFDRAEDLFMESLNEFRKLGNQRGMAEALAGLAGLAIELGEEEWGAQLLAAAEARLEIIDGVWWPADRVEIKRAKERLNAELEDDLSTLWKKGEEMTLDEAIACAEEGW